MFRIVFGAVIAINWLMLAVDWDAWFSERGYVPAWLGSIWFGDYTMLGLHTGIKVPRIDLLHGMTDPRYTISFYAAVVICCILTSVGLGTRFFALLAAIGTVSLQHRDGAILHGGDTLVRLMALYLAITPCGAACSLDRLITQWRAKTILPPAIVSIWGQRLIQYNLALIYFTTIWLKWDGNKWRHLTATYYPERLAEFYRFPYPEFLRSLWVAHISTFGTMVVEFSMGTLVFYKPARKWVLISGILLHGYIEYTMNIPMFSYAMISVYIAFYEGNEISGFFERLGMHLRKWHVVLRYPAGMRLQPRAVGFFQAIDPLRMVSYLPGESPGWSAETIGGRKLSPVQAILTRCPSTLFFCLWPKFLSNLFNSTLEPLPAANPEPTLKTQPTAAPGRRKG